jgi:membrane associated rhomboid family serine protease
MGQKNEGWESERPNSPYSEGETRNADAERRLYAADGLGLDRRHQPGARRMFIIIPVGVQYTARRYPMVTFTLMGLNTALYLVSFFMWLGNLGDGADNTAGDWQIHHLGLIPAEKTWYTFFTHMFVHGGLFHWLGNMVYLFLFGSCVEDRIGRWQYVLFYLVGGLAAALTYMLAIPDVAPAAAAGLGTAPVIGLDEIPMVGASGAISACIGGFLLLLAKTKINFRYFVFIFFRFFNGDFWLPTWLVVSFWFLSDLFWAVVSYQDPEANDGTAFAAHVGGMLAGLALMGIWKACRRFIPQPKDPDEETGPEPVRAKPLVKVVETPCIFVSADGNQIGPFTPTQVREMITLGSVGGDAYFWMEGMPEWRSVAEFGQ